MARLRTFGLLFFLTATLSPAHVLAQDLSRSSTATGASSNQALGANIGTMAQSFGENVPDIQRAAQSTRGDTFGAEVQVFGTAGDATGARGAQAARRGANLRAPTQPGQRRGTAAGQTVPVTMSLGFAYTAKVPTNVNGQLTSCLARLPSFGTDSQVRARVDQDTVVLEGTVATQRDRALAMQVVALQPGVHKIDNRLEVAEAAKAPPTRPAAQ